jgi:hypothetical protein
MAAAAQAEAARVQSMIGTVSSTLTAEGVGRTGSVPSSSAPSVVQHNNFAEMDPEVAVVAAGQSLAAVARRAGA